MAGGGLLLRAGRGLAGTRALSGLAARWQRDGFVQPVEVVGEEGMVETQQLLARLEGEAERGQLPGQFDNLHFKHPAIAQLCTQVSTSLLTRDMALSLPAARPAGHRVGPARTRPGPSVLVSVRKV